MISTQKDSSILFTKEDLLNNKELCFKFVIESNENTLIVGKILDEYGVPISKGCIEVYYSKVSKEKIFLGRTFSNEVGEYGFTLHIKSSFIYYFSVYGSIG